MRSHARSFSSVILRTRAARLTLRFVFHACPCQPVAQDSWFPGYAWTVAYCSACFAHMGWRFTPVTRGRALSGAQSFWGLRPTHGRSAARSGRGSKQRRGKSEQRRGRALVRRRFGHSRRGGERSVGGCGRVKLSLWPRLRPSCETAKEAGMSTGARCAAHPGVALLGCLMR